MAEAGDAGLGRTLPWRRGMCVRDLPLLALGGFLLLSTAAPAGLDQPWDPPAVDVFPDHVQAAGKPDGGALMTAAGRRLFSARFNSHDGAGRPRATGDSKPTLRVAASDQEFTRLSGPDANSCAGCHNQPATGGSGDFAANVFVGAHFADPPTREITAEITSERNTIGLFGAGAIETLAREMTEDLQAIKSDGVREARRFGRPVHRRLETKGVSFGAVTFRPDGTYDIGELEGIDADLVVKPFGFKGVVISLREFTINALNQHHGIQAVERFGWERTGLYDFDGDGVEVEFTIGQVSALSLFQASLPAPTRRAPLDSNEAARISRGEQLFATIGCTSCHRSALPLRRPIFSEPNPFNRPGNLVPGDLEAVVELKLAAGSPSEGGVVQVPGGQTFVAAYTDLKRHRICDEADPFLCNERRRQDFVPTDMFLTAKLWDVSTSAPYGHRGDCSTLSDVILHHSAEGVVAKQAFRSLDDASKRAVIDFLRSLGSGSDDPQRERSSP